MPADSPAPTGRLVVERIEGLELVGWAAEADGQAAAVQLLLDGQVQTIEPQRFERQDVSDALGQPRGAAYGFRLPLPPAIWRQGGAAVAGLQLRAGSLQAAAPSPAPLAGTVAALADLPMGELRDRALQQAWAHVQALGDGAGLPATTLAWLGDEAARCQAEARAAEAAALAAASIQGVLEQAGPLQWTGWARRIGAETEQLGLLVAGQALPAQVIRTERVDVQQATGSPRLLLGFELELPGAIWRHADAQGQVPLTLTVDGHLLQPAPAPLTQAALRSELTRLRALVHPASPPTQGEAHYLSLLLLEHLAAAQLLPQLDATEAAWVHAMAAHWGLERLFGPAPAAALEQSASASQDPLTLNVWRGLRAFNRALSDSSSAPLQLLDQTLEQQALQGEARHRLLMSLTPYFCGRGDYRALRQRLDAAALRALQESHSAWELSLLLTELVASADLGNAVPVACRLAGTTAGWLNTECVAEVGRELRRSWPAAPAAQAQAQALVDHLLALLDQQAGSYWGRIHDLHLVDAQLELLALCERLPEAQAERVQATSLRHHALNASFWQRLRAHRPREDWPADLRDAERRFEQIEAGLRQPVTARQVWTLLPLLSPACASGNLEARQALRELLLSAAPDFSELPAAEAGAAAAAALAALSSLDGTESLRLAAHPLAGAAWVAAQPELRERVRQASGAAPRPPGGPLQRALAALQAGPDAPLGWDELRPLTGAAHQFVGIHLACVAWQQRRRQWTGPQAEAWLGLVHECWLAAFAQAAGQPTPPAALLSSWAVLHAARDDNAAARLAQTLECQLLGRHGPALLDTLPPPASACHWRAPDALRSTLVAVMSQRERVVDRQMLIGSTWGRELDRRGIPWMMVVGDGDGRHTGQVLALAAPDDVHAAPQRSLALLEWVMTRTDATHLLTLNDDCHLAVEAWFDTAPQLTQHHLGRRRPAGSRFDRLVSTTPASAAVQALPRLDKSPAPGRHADGRVGLSLSRLAMARVLALCRTTAGARLMRGAFRADKLLGELLALADLPLNESGPECLLRLQPGHDGVTVNAGHNGFEPGPDSPTAVTCLDNPEAEMPALHRAATADTARAGLWPPRLWPTFAPPRTGTQDGCNQLELLSPASRVRAFAEAPMLVVAVARNERLLMPHFLQHYRQLGARHFVLVDNLSDDGTRAYLQAQPDVLLYSADTEYRHSHYGVAWQQAVLGAHALGKWVVLADIDEFLVYPDCEHLGLSEWLAQRDAEGAEAVSTLMVDMYPAGELAEADFSRHPPFEVARHFDPQPLLPWRVGSGCFSNSGTWLSGLRHRLIPDSAPNFYTAQKVAVLRYQPWVRLSEGLHYVSNRRLAAAPACFAHFKYHAGFREKVLQEVARGQHFNGAEEYRKYLAMLAEAQGPWATAGASSRYEGSVSFGPLFDPAKCCDT